MTAMLKRSGLKVPAKTMKRRRLGSSENACFRRSAERPNHVWSYDFVMDQTSDGRRLKILAVVDEYTRECLALEVERSIEAVDVVEMLRKVIAKRGAPENIRSDNGGEFIAQVVRDYLQESGAQTLYIEPGAPWENAYSETFNSRFGDEVLKREVFDTLLEAKVLVESIQFVPWEGFHSTSNQCLFLTLALYKNSVFSRNDKGFHVHIPHAIAIH